jgi:hypothetical protein
MKIRITESQYKVLINKPKDVVFGRVNEVKRKILSSEEEDEKIKEILDYMRSGGKFNLHKNYRWFYGQRQRDKTGKFQNALDQIKKIQEEFENKRIEEILDYVRNGGEFIRKYNKDENYRWLYSRFISTKKEKLYNILDQITEIQEEFENKRIEEILDYVRNGGEFSRHKNYKRFYGQKLRDKTGKFQNALDQIKKIQEEFENKRIEEILDYVRNGGEFIRDPKKDENYRWLINKLYHNKKEELQNVLDQITEIQTELGIKKEWWGEKTIKNILEEMKFNGVTPRHKYKECKNSLTCKQYEFDIYLPYDENNVKINKNIPENGIIFEYDGIQHFEFNPYFHKTEEKFNSQIFRDKEKNLYCRKNNIKLVRIPYTSKTKEDITRDIESALNDPSTFILTGDYPKAGWNK